MSFWVVKYNVESLKKGARYLDMGVEAPSFIEPSYADYETAARIAEEMCKTNGGEEIEVTLSNDKTYKGPRYIYKVAEDDRPPSEVIDYGEETGNPV